MVARIGYGKSMVRLLNYNEQKVKNDKAELILVNQFGCDAEMLSFKNKLARFEKMTATNTRAMANAIHISLNFDPGEHLPMEQLQDIAVDYMEGIGFGDQPYLVYEHFDAGHPHIHIVTTNIQADGKRIDLHNIGRNQSEATRKALEEKYGLVPAEGRIKAVAEMLRPAIGSAEYSKSETKHTVAGIVDTVLQQYCYSSFTEYNAVLRCFNVRAERGQEGSRMHEKGGLIYSIIDRQGLPVGMPIKASAFFSKPTLKNIEARFQDNAAVKKTSRPQTRSAITSVLQEAQSLSKEDFTKALSRRNISVIFWENKAGFTYGVTFVNHAEKVVFNGSELGKEFGAKQILERLQTAKESKPEVPKESQAFAGQDHDHQSHQQVYDLVNALMQPEGQAEALPYELRKKRRKRRKPNQ